MPSWLKASWAPTRKAARARRPSASAGKIRRRRAASGASDAEDHDHHDLEPARRVLQREALERGRHRARLDLRARHQSAAGRRGRVLVVQRRVRGADHHHLAPDRRGRELARCRRRRSSACARSACRPCSRSRPMLPDGSCRLAAELGPRRGDRRSDSSAVDLERHVADAPVRVERVVAVRRDRAAVLAGRPRRRRCALGVALLSASTSVVAMTVRGCARTAVMSALSSAMSRCSLPDVCGSVNSKS